MNCFLLWATGLHLAMAATVPMPNTDMSPLGPIYLPVSNFSGSIFDDARDQLAQFIEDTIQSGDSEFGPMFNDTAFSASVFSLKTGESIFDYHYQAPGLPPESYTKGKVSEDTIYRTGSLGKAMTVYTWLVDIGDAAYHDPITKYIPEFAEAMKSYKNPIMSTNWSQVTIGSLASQTSGIGRDFHLGDLATQSFGMPPPETALEQGYPPLGNETVVQCDSYGDKLPQCTRQQFLQGIIDHPPVNHPYYSPSYSNLAFSILGFAYESITGIPIDQASDTLFNDKLGMPSTTAHVPAPGADAVIPFNDSFALFTYDIGVQGPAGNQYTSTKDLRTWGHAIYTNKLLDEVVTRRWLKPVTFTSRWTSAVGGPWEIYRIALPVNTLTNSSRIVDTYIKGGNIGQYATTFALVPDYEIGFSILSAGAKPGSQKAPVRSKLVDVFYNAFEAAMKEQARATFTGTFRATDRNSSVVLEVDDATGVHIKQWISNGTDMTTNVYQSTFHDFRLYPTDLSYEEGDMTYRKYIQANLFQEGGQQMLDDPWSDLNDYWVLIDGFMYNNLATDSWVVGFDADGMVQSVESQALRSRLYREG